MKGTLLNMKQINTRILHYFYSDYLHQDIRKSQG